LEIYLQLDQRRWNNHEGQENAYILCKNKYSHLIQHYNKLLANIDLSFTFDESTNLVSHVFYVVIDNENWAMNSTCTCCNYFKTYMCMHIMAVSVSKDLVKIPAHCKTMVTVGVKPKRGRIPDALKGLKKQ
jgi:hypothetical protein